MDSTIGKRDFYADTEIGLRPFRNNISYFGIDVDQLQRQNPALASRLFKELMQLFAAAELHPLPYTRYSANQVEKAFRHMQQSRQIGKILVGNYAELQIEADNSKVTCLPPFSLPAGSCYLITGGTSGLGLRLARWLGESGATDLVLCSRKGEVSDADLPQLKMLEELGVNVHARRCDVSQRSRNFRTTAVSGKKYRRAADTWNKTASLWDTRYSYLFNQVPRGRTPLILVTSF